MTGVDVKIFLGYLITPELSDALEKSINWKQLQITKEIPIEMVQHEGKRYIGQYFPNGSIPLDKIRDAEKDFVKQLQLLCPSYSFVRNPVLVFPQMFIN